MLRSPQQRTANAPIRRYSSDFDPWPRARRDYARCPGLAQAARGASRAPDLFCRHTSAGLLIQENAAADVRADLEAFFDRLAPEEAGRYRHTDEGADDMPAHIRTALTGVQLTVPILQGRLALGTWQGIYLFEHRRAPRRREIALHLIGE
jgi:secondary thiamine-phosphate synthase enzyme